MQVASRIGVPAGPLLDSRWTSLAASLGYDIVTYKTIRTAASAGHAPPNVLYLQADGKQLPAAGDTTPLQVRVVKSSVRWQRPSGSAMLHAAAASTICVMQLTLFAGSKQPCHTSSSTLLFTIKATSQQAVGRCTLFDHLLFYVLVVCRLLCAVTCGPGMLASLVKYTHVASVHLLLHISLLLLLQAAGVEQPDEAAATAVAITNSFGMPSMDAAFLMADIPAAQAALRPGQVRRMRQKACQGSPQQQQQCGGSSTNSSSSGGGSSSSMSWHSFTLLWKTTAWCCCDGCWLASCHKAAHVKRRRTCNCQLMQPQTLPGCCCFVLFNM